MSGAALRAFVKVAEEWSLGVAEQASMLQAGIKELEGWFAVVRGDGSVAPPKAVRFRVGAVLGIHRRLSMLLDNDTARIRWLRSSNPAPTFAGQSPLAVILSGNEDDLFHTRRFLDRCLSRDLAPS